MSAAGVGPQSAGQRLHRATSRAAQMPAAVRGHPWNIGCIRRPIMMAHDVLPPVLSRKGIVVVGSKVRPGIDAARMLLARDGRGVR